MGFDDSAEAAVYDGLAAARRHSISLHMFNTEEDVDRALITIDDEVLHDVGALA